MFDYPYLFFEVIAFLVAVFQYNKIKHTPYVYFIPYLFFIVAYEIGTLYNCCSIAHSNLWISNITMTISFLFYSVFLSNLIKSPKTKKWIKRLIVLSIFCSVLNTLFVQGFWKLDTITILLQFGIIILINCIYFYELMNFSQKQLVIIKLPEFWLNTGLLFFCLAKFLFFSAFAYMAYHNNYAYRFLFDVIANLACAILYPCLTVSFLCISKTNNQ
jgi:hypothetical protein